MVENEMENEQEIPDDLAVLSEENDVINVSTISCISYCKGL